MLLAGGLLAGAAAAAADFGLRFATGTNLPVSLLAPGLVAMVATHRLRRLRERGTILVDPIFKLRFGTVHLIREDTDPARFARFWRLELAMWASIVIAWALVPVAVTLDLSPPWQR